MCEAYLHTVTIINSAEIKLMHSKICQLQRARKVASSMLLLLPHPLRGMGAWRKTMEPQKQGNFPGPGPEIVERQRVVKERAAQRVRS